MRRKQPPAQCRSARVPPSPNAAPSRAASLTSGLQAPAQRRPFFFVLPRHAESGGGGSSSSVGGRDEAQARRPRRRAREREAERQRLSQHTGQRGLGLSRLRRLAFGLPVSVAPSLSLKAKPAPVSSANDDGGGLARCVQRAKPRECVRALVCAHNARTPAKHAHSEALYGWTLTLARAHAHACIVTCREEDSRRADQGFPNDASQARLGRQAGETMLR